MPVTKVCEECSKAYRIPPSRAATSRFCCIACANAAKVVIPRKSYYKPKPGGMRCAICGGEFWALGVHVKHKHGICAKDYKAQYGLLLTAPLVHEEVSEVISQAMRQRLLDPEYKREVSELCRENGKATKGKKQNQSPSPAASELVAQRNRERADKYLRSIADKVQEVLDRTGYIHHVRKELGVGRTTVKNMIRKGIVSMPLARQPAAEVPRC